MLKSVSQRLTAALIAWATLILLSYTTAAQECPGSSSPHFTDAALEEAYSSCTSIEGDVVLGVADCSVQCTVTSLAALSDLQTISGSLIVQCCSVLEESSGLSALTIVSGTLRIYYNQHLHTVGGFGALRSVGNLEISQNGNLTRILGLSALEMIDGHLQISHNQRLVDLDGLSNLRSIGGSHLVAGHALNVLYNPVLLDLRWLRNLTQIEFGTVHIEGNLLLCYAGYPQWTVGGFNARPPSGDRGIDWRTLLSVGVPTWQYSWGVEGGGYPTLVIQNNSPYDQCGDATCHVSCVEGAGCLGPLDPDLCGTCFGGSCEIGATSASASCDPTPIPYWPPTEMPYSLLFGVLFAICGLILLALVLLGGRVTYRICRRLRARRKGSFDIHEEIEMGVRRREEGGGGGFVSGVSSSSQHSSIIAQSSERESFQHKKTGEGNVVLTSSNYRPVSTLANTSPTSHPSPHSTTVTPVTSDTITPTAGTSVVTAATTSPAVPVALKRSELQGSLNSIPEEVEEGEEEGEETEERRDAAVGRKPVKRLYRKDTLTRLKEGESVCVQMNFPRNQINIKKEIGKGDFGTVFFAEAKKLTSGEKKTPVIVKQLKDNSSKEEQENFLRPVEAMSLLQHPNVVSLLGACVKGEPIMILMEYCSHGNLKTYLVRKRREAATFRESGKLATIACQMAAGLNYLHSQSVAHNDFAVRSCLVSSNETIKLGDYGLTKHIFKEDYYSRGGHQKAWPVRWMAPEQMIVKSKMVLDSQPASTTGNVWSFGVSLWEVSTFAQWPYFDLSNEEVIDTVQSSWQCTLENPFQSADPLSPLYNIMQLCWKLAEERPTMADILSQLEEIRDDITSNTPSSARKKRVTSSHSPKTTPTATPTPPHPSVNTRKKHRGKNYAPRRPAPKVPEDGSLKRGTTIQQLQGPNDAQHHPLEKSTKAPHEAHVDDKPCSIKEKMMGAGMIKVNPLIAEMEDREKVEVAVGPTAGGGEVWRGGEGEGVILVNRVAGEEEREAEEEENEEEKGEQVDGGREREEVVEVKAEEESSDWEGDFILEPPEDFSQYSTELGDETSLGLHAGSHELYDPSESQCTSVDDFEESFEQPPPLPEPSPSEQHRVSDGETTTQTLPEQHRGDISDDLAQASPHTHHYTDKLATHSYPNTKRQKRKKHNVKKHNVKKHNGESGRRTRRRDSGTRVSPLIPSYHSHGEDLQREATGAPLRRGEARGVKSERGGWEDTPDLGEEEDNLDSRYRRPTGRITALLRRAPSWGRSGKDGGTAGDDDIPNVVYDDEVSALIW